MTFFNEGGDQPGRQPMPREGGAEQVPHLGIPPRGHSESHSHTQPETYDLDLGHVAVPPAIVPPHDRTRPPVFVVDRTPDPFLPLNKEGLPVGTPSMRLVGQFSGHVTAREYADRLMQERTECKPPDSRELNGDEQVLMGELYDAYGRVGDHLRADLRDRLPLMSHTRVFDSANNLNTTVQEMHGDGHARADAVYHPETGLWLAADTHQDLPTIASHEVGHALTGHEFEVTNVRPGINKQGLLDKIIERNITRVGYARWDQDGVVSPKYEGLNELAADLISARASQYRISKWGNPVDLRLRYTPLLLIGDGIAVRAAADEICYHPAQVERSLLTGALEADDRHLDVIERTLGSRAMDRFVSLPRTLTLEEAADVAQELKLPKAVDTIEAARQGLPHRMFSWRLDA
jgi:hypothetical protein